MMQDFSSRREPKKTRLLKNLRGLYLGVSNRLSICRHLQ
uniref:Uncharacterized protein n=1 Tax=Ascaris lumbricoides TaxID=6252 RepID=A0A0M3ISM3_ASCLU